MIKEEANQQGRATNPESDDCTRLYLRNTSVKKKKKPKLWRDGEREIVQKMCHGIRGREEQWECCREEEK